MDLRTFENFWPLHNGNSSIYLSLNSNIKCDVVIMGAGISGSLIADYISDDGHDIVILDKRHPGFGSTSASTALIQYEIDTPLRELKDKVGIDHAVRSYKMCIDSIYDLKRICNRFKDNCDFQLKESFQYASNKHHYLDHVEELNLRQIHKVSDTSWLSSHEIKKKYGFNKTGGILSRDGAILDPYKVTTNLLNCLKKKNVRIFDKTKVVDIIHERNKVILKTSSGHTVTAKKLVVATGYESQKYLKKRVEIPNTSFAILSKPIDKKKLWYNNSLIWETARPYLYIRTTSDNRILIGGLDDPKHNPVERNKKLKNKSQKLKKEFNELFPEIDFNIDYSWAGFFGETKDGLPYIGSVPERPNTYFSLGFGGNGISYSVIAAKIIKDLVLDKKNDDAEIYKFNR